MSDSTTPPLAKSVDSLQATSSLQASDWLGSLSFGDALRQSIILLQQEFRWLVVLFFLGGTGLALILLPVNTTLEILAELMMQELLNFPPNFDVLLNLLTENIIWGTLQTFVTFFIVFLLNAIAIHRVIKKVSSLDVIANEYQAPHFPTLQIVGAGLVIAGLLAIANLFVVFVPVVLLFCYFVPAILIIEGRSIRHALSQSFEMRQRHSLRILGAILLGGTFLVFAHTLGIHVYLSLEFLFQLYGLSLGIAGPVLLIVLTQIPVSMVAPLVPLFSVAFYSGARGARAHHKYEKFLRSVKQQHTRTAALIPLDSTQPPCRNCGTPLRPGSAFCSRCGAPTTSSTS